MECVGIDVKIQKALLERIQVRPLRLQNNPANTSFGFSLNCVLFVLVGQKSGKRLTAHFACAYSCEGLAAKGNKLGLRPVTEMQHGE